MKKILVVEDDPDIRELLTYNLKREGFAVEIAVNGADGFQLATQIEPDLMVLDLMLPELSGIEVCKKIRAHNAISELPMTLEGPTLNRILECTEWKVIWVGRP